MCKLQSYLTCFWLDELSNFSCPTSPPQRCVSMFSREKNNLIPALELFQIIQPLVPLDFCYTTHLLGWPCYSVHLWFVTSLYTSFLSFRTALWSSFRGFGINLEYNLTFHVLRIVSVVASVVHDTVWTDHSCVVPVTILIFFQVHSGKLRPAGLWQDCETQTTKTTAQLTISSPIASFADSK